MIPYSLQGEGWVERITLRLRQRYSEWLVHPKYGPGLFWLDSGARDACYLLYGLFPSVKREA